MKDRVEGSTFRVEELTFKDLPSAVKGFGFRVRFTSDTSEETQEHLVLVGELLGEQLCAGLGRHYHTYVSSLSFTLFFFCFFLLLLSCNFPSFALRLFLVLLRLQNFFCFLLAFFSVFFRGA